MEEMKYGVAWNDSYKLGAEKVDAQHKKLFELVSDLVDACLSGSEIEKVKETLDFLVNYTVQHFTEEEALQVLCGFPDYERHKTLHEDFKVTVGELVKEFNESGSSMELSNSMNKIVVRWLINHIRVEDKKIGRHIEKTGYKI